MPKSDAEVYLIYIKKYLSIQNAHLSALKDKSADEMFD